MLVVDGARLRHAMVRDLPELVPAGSLLVVNDTRVIPARLHGHKVRTGGKVELLLVERVDDPSARGALALPGVEIWTAMGRATRRLRPDTDLAFGAGLGGRVLRREEGDGLLRVALWDAGGAPVAERIERLGAVPLPPYLGRAPEPSDRERYQTVYARHAGAVAAPTAGLHFTAELLERLAALGVRRTAVTLHVGPGTFRPVAVDDLDDHPMHAERFVVRPEAAEAVRRARACSRPVIAVGTTVVRTLEAAADPHRPGCVRAGTATTRLLIQPGYRFQVVDGLLTNFHLPESTLLALVYAFGGTRQVSAAYREAIRERYRFYSYGDAMYLPPGQAEEGS